MIHMNYIDIYYNQIKNKDVVVSEKVAKLFKHLHDKLNGKEEKYIFDQEIVQHMQ